MGLTGKFLFILGFLFLTAPVFAIESCISALSEIEQSTTLTTIQKRTLLSVLKIAKKKNFEALPFYKALVKANHVDQKATFILLDPVMIARVTRKPTSTKIKIELLASKRFGMNLSTGTLQQIVDWSPSLGQSLQVFNGFLSLFQSLSGTNKSADLSLAIGFFGVLKMIQNEIVTNPQLQSVTINAGMVTNEKLRNILIRFGFVPTTVPIIQQTHWSWTITSEDQTLWDALSKI